MNQSISISHDEYNKLNQRLTELESVVKHISKMLDLGIEPPYGSDEWWEWSDAKAREAIRNGETITLRNAKDIDDFFDSL